MASDWPIYNKSTNQLTHSFPFGFGKNRRSRSAFTFIIIPCILEVLVGNQDQLSVRIRVRCTGCFALSRVVSPAAHACHAHCSTSTSRPPRMCPPSPTGRSGLQTRNNSNLAIGCSGSRGRKEPPDAFTRSKWYIRGTDVSRSLQS